MGTHEASHRRRQPNRPNTVMHRNTLDGQSPDSLDHNKELERQRIYCNHPSPCSDTLYNTMHYRMEWNIYYEKQKTIYYNTTIQYTITLYNKMYDTVWYCLILYDIVWYCLMLYVLNKKSFLLTQNVMQKCFVSRLKVWFILE